MLSNCGCSLSTFIMFVMTGFMVVFEVSANSGLAAS